MYLCMSGEMIDASEALGSDSCKKSFRSRACSTKPNASAASSQRKRRLRSKAAKRAIISGAVLRLPKDIEIEALHFGAMTVDAQISPKARARFSKSANLRLRDVKTMRAVVFDTKGDADILACARRRRSAGAARLRKSAYAIHAFGINRADVLQRRGLYPAPPDAIDPHIPGPRIRG